MNLVLEKGCDWQPWWRRVPYRDGTKVELPLKNHLLSAKSFISAPPVQALGSHIIIIIAMLMIGRVIALVSASGVGLYWLATLGKDLFCNFHLCRTG